MRVQFLLELFDNLLPLRLFIDRNRNCGLLMADRLHFPALSSSLVCLINERRAEARQTRNTGRGSPEDQRGDAGRETPKANTTDFFIVILTGEESIWFPRRFLSRAEPAPKGRNVALT